MRNADRVCLGEPYGGALGARCDSGGLAFALAPDGRTAIAGRIDGPARKWDVAAGTVLRVMPGVVGSAFAMDGERIAALAASTVSVWTLDGALLHTLQAEAARRIDVTTDGGLVVHGCADIRAFDREGRALWSHRAPPSSVMPVTAVAPDGTRSVVLGSDGAGTLRDASGVRAIQLPVTQLAGIVLTTDGTLVTAGESPTLAVWDLSTDPPTRRERAPEQSAIRDFAMVPDGSRYAARWSGELWIVDVHSGERRALPKRFTMGSIYGLRFSDDGSVLGWYDGERGRLVFVDAATGRELRPASAAPAGPIASLDTSDDGSVVAVSRNLDEGGSQVELWTTDHPQAPRECIPAAAGGALSRDGRMLAIVSEAALRVREVAAGRPERELARDRCHHYPTFSPDGAWIATVDNVANCLLVRDVASGQTVLRIATPGRFIWSLCFSHETTLLAAGDDAGAVTVYRLPTGEVAATLRRHAQSVEFVAFTTGPAQLVTAHADGVVRIWDVATWRHVCALTKDASNQHVFATGIAGAALSRDGRTLVAPVRDSIRVVELAGRGHTGVSDLEGGQGARIGKICLVAGDKAMLVSGSDGTVTMRPVPAPTLGAPDFAPASPVPPPPPRRLELRDGKSAKFWEVSLEDDVHVITFGRIGTAGQTQVKEFASPDKARAAYEKAIAKKLAEGYAEVTSASEPPPPAKAPKASTSLAAERFAERTRVEVIAGRVIETRIPIAIELLALVNEWTHRLGYRVACVPAFDLHETGTLGPEIPVSMAVGIRAASACADDGPSGPIAGDTLRAASAQARGIPAAFWEAVADLVSEQGETPEDTRELRWHTDDAVYLVPTGPLAAGALVFGSVQPRALAEKRSLPFEQGVDMKQAPHKKVVAGVRVGSVTQPVLQEVRVDEESERAHREEAAAARVPGTHVYHLVARYD